MNMQETSAIRFDQQFSPVVVERMPLLRALLVTRESLEVAFFTILRTWGARPTSNWSTRCWRSRPHSTHAPTKPPPSPSASKPWPARNASPRAAVLSRADDAPGQLHRPPPADRRQHRRPLAAGAGDDAGEWPAGGIGEEVAGRAEVALQGPATRRCRADVQGTDIDARVTPQHGQSPIIVQHLAPH